MDFKVISKWNEGEGLYSLIKDVKAIKGKKTTRKYRLVVFYLDAFFMI